VTDSLGALYVNVNSSNFEHAEDTPHTTGDVGVQMLAVRNDVLASLVSLDGDYSPLQVDASGALYVTFSGDIDVTFDYARDSVAGGTDVGAFVLAIRNDVLASLVDTDGDYAPLQVDAQGALYVTGDITVDNTFDFAEDSPHTTGDIGAFMLAVRNDVLGSLSDTDGDYSALQVAATGELYTQMSSHAITNANALPISIDNNPNSETNPIFVQHVETIVLAESVHDYTESTDVGVGSSVNVDLAAVGDLSVEQVWVSAAGQIRWQVIKDATGTPEIVGTGFLQGRQGDWQELHFKPVTQLTAAEVFRLTLTNRQGVSMNIYTTTFARDV